MKNLQSTAIFREILCIYKIEKINFTKYYYFNILLGKICLQENMIITFFIENI